MRCTRLVLSTLLLLSVVVFAGCREEGDIQISSLEFRGVEQVDKAALANALETKKGSWLPWGRKRYFDRRAFEADLKRIQAFYADRGFPDARVRSFDVKLNETQDKVAITLDIDEGEPVRVAAIELRGFEVLAGSLEPLRQSLPLQPGQPLDRQLLVASRERVLNALRDEGYLYADVSLTEPEVRPGERAVVMQATPGVLAYFGPITIAGQVSVDDDVIRRYLTFQQGERFSRRAMRDSQRKLYGLELFEFVNVQSAENEDQTNTAVPVRVTVGEGKHQKVTTGIGYGSEEKARARIRWDHVNLFGGAQHGGAEAKWSSLDRGVRLDYREPYFFSKNLSLTFDGQAWQAAEPVYSSNQVGGRVMVRYQPNVQNRASVSLLNQFQRSTIDSAALEDFTVRDDLIALGLDPTDGVSSGTLSAVAFDAGRNTTTSLLDARSGYVVNGHIEQAGRWLRGSYSYWTATLEGRHYVSLFGRAVVANRLRAGSIDASGDSAANVPFYKRYFLGGASSIRGWGRFEVSPLSGFGFPIGGLSMLEGSSEVRVPIAGKWSAVAFADYGNVWSNTWDVDVGDLRYAVGPGLRYLTPIGPVRVDLGYQVNPIENLLVEGAPQKRRWRVHFSIGQAF